MDGAETRIAFLLLIISAFLLSYSKASDCENHQFSCEGKYSQCYDASEKCDGKKDCDSGRDETNCTVDTVTKHLIVNNYKESENNFAWLVTPVIFGIGCIYATYKCLKEGLCTIHRLRRHAAANPDNPDSESGTRHYFVLDRWSFHSLARLPTSRLGTTANIRGTTHRQLVLVTNHSFSISLSDMQARSPSTEGDLEGVPPPTYDEAVNTETVHDSTGVNNNGFIPLPNEDPDLPSYNEAASILNREDSCNSATQLNPGALVSESRL